MFETPQNSVHTTLVGKAPRNEVSKDYQNYKENPQECEEEELLDHHYADQGTPAFPFRLWLIEPMILLLVFAYRLSSTVLKNQVLYQTCTAILEYNSTDCYQLSSANASEHIVQIELQVQRYAARVLLVLDLVQSIVPAVCGPFAGVWADRFGRKPLLVTSFTGYLLTYLASAVIAHAAADARISPWYFVLATLPTVLSGGAVFYAVAAVCYIADVSTDSQRPYRMILYEASMYVGLFFGSFAASYVFEAGGATSVFASSAGIVGVAILVIATLMPESLKLRSVQQKPLIVRVNEEQDEEAAGATTTSTTTITGPMGNHRDCRLVDLGILQCVWRTAFKPRDCNDRAIIWLVIVTMLISALVADGTANVFYLFVRANFHWTVKTFTMYESYNLLALIVGNIVGIWLLRKICGLSLLHVTIVAFLSQTFSCLLKAFAYADWQLYAAIGAGMLKSIAMPMSRTMLTNLVPALELGQILSLQSTLQSLMPLFASPMYTIIYSVTLNSFPGFFNVISMNLCLLAVGCLLVIVRKKHAHPVYYDRLLN